MKHTPGPWKFRQKRGNNIYEHIVHNEHYKIIAFLDAEGASGPSEYEKANEVKANAALIAAAPEILANLKELIDAMSSKSLQKMFLPSDFDRLHTAKLAVARAEGGAE